MFITNIRHVQQNEMINKNRVSLRHLHTKKVIKEKVRKEISLRPYSDILPRLVAHLEDQRLKDNEVNVS